MCAWIFFFWFIYSADNVKPVKSKQSYGNVENFLWKFSEKFINKNDKLVVLVINIYFEILYII